MIYDSFNPEFISRFKEILQAAKRVVITGHMAADEDAIGAALLLKRWIEKNYADKEIRLLFTGPKKGDCSALPDYGEIEFTEDMAKGVEAGDTVIFADGNQWSRFSRRSEELKEKGLTTVVIDHHQPPVDDFNLGLVVADYPATVLMLYKMWGEELTGKEEAELFMAGILGDTGSLRYLRPENAEVLEAVRVLLPRMGSNIESFQLQYRSIPVKAFKALQELTAKTVFVEDHKFPYQYSFIDGQYKQAEDLSDSDLDLGAHEYSDELLRRVEGYRWGFVVYPTATGRCRASFRSVKGSVDVQDLAVRMGIGGGHTRAAGATIPTADVKEAVEMILEWLKTNELKAD